VVSVNVVGCPALRASSTEVRLDFIVSITRAIRRHGWTNLDAIIFPAGFLRTDHWLATMTASARRTALDQSVVGEVARVAASKLNDGSPGCILVMGIDTHRYQPWGFRGDQAAAAFNTGGCIAVTRKVFPVDGDTNEWGRAAYLLDRQDADGDERFFPLANGQRAMIAVCYDAFALSELALGPTGKLRAMRYRTDPVSGWAEFEPAERHDWLDALRDQIAHRAPRVLLNPIHGFVRPGSCRFWQRHGLASASSYLDGALCVGAAHFKSRLPLPHESWLATAKVPRDHLKRGNLRRSHEKRPQDAFELKHRRTGRCALLRLFQV
jgi:hypothetical protein